MKLLITAIAIMLTLTGCGAHLIGKPETSVVEKAPQVAVDVPKPTPNTVTLTLPNWPTVAYQYGEAFVLLVVKDPSSFIIPKELVFRDGERTIVMPMVKPAPDKKPQ